MNATNKQTGKQWYHEYLKSRSWREFRRNILERARLPGVNVNVYSCENCGRTTEYDFIQVHHLSYERVGRERPEDVAIICESCHLKAHGLPEDIEQRIGSEIHVSHVIASLFDKRKRRRRKRRE